MRPLNVLTWHTHGSYLYYLTQAPHRFHVVVKPGQPPGYGGRCGPFPWGDNLVEVPFDEVASRQFDCILYQDDHQYLEDRHSLLSPAQRRLPQIYLEHDPPREHPTDTRHPVDDPGLLLVHCTPFNALMWDSGRTPTRIIEHGVMPQDLPAERGALARGLVVINNLPQRGRRLGADVYAQVRARLPLDLVGMGAEVPGLLGEVEHWRMPQFMASYRFLFNPIRYTSLGLAVLEAMMVGLPVVALATTEMVTVIESGRNGYVDTRIERLVEAMQRLLRDPGLARELGTRARACAMERFHINRFVADWNAALALVTGTPVSQGRVATC
jgi:hypothetical protein